MITIHKYSFPYAWDRVQVEMPSGARILRAGIQAHGVNSHTGAKEEWVVFWALVHTDKEKTKRDFQLVGTGQKVPQYAMNYIDTVQTGGLVLHLFELKPGKIHEHFIPSAENGS